MVYAKTFTSFARHAFQKAAYAGHAHASPHGASQASSFFNQSFAGAGRSQLGSGTIASRFQSQFGAHAGKNNPSQGNTQTTVYGQLQNPMAASTTNNDDGSKDNETMHRPSLSLTRQFQNTVFTPISDAELVQSSGTRGYSTSSSQPILSNDVLIAGEEPYSNINPLPNLPSTSSENAPIIESYETQVIDLMEKGDFNSVISVYNDMKRLGFVPTARLYNNIIVSMTRTRAREPVDNIVDTYTEMISQEIQPEIATISTLIETLCKRSSEVADIIAETNLRIERDVSDFSKDHHQLESLKMKLKKEKNVSTALDLFNASTEAMYQPHSLHTFNAMLKALANHGMAQEVLHVYEKMEISRISPDANTFVHLITAFGKHGDMRSAIECYNEYKVQASILPGHDENIIYEALISSYFAAGDANGGVEFLKKVQTIPAKYVSRKLLDAVIAGLCHRGDLEEALKWVHRMKTTTTLPNPTVHTVRPVLLYASKERNLATAKEAFELVADGRIATGHLWKPELVLFANLCLREGDLNTAVVVMDELVLQKILPDADVCARFLRKLSITSGVDRALEFFERVANVAQASLLSSSTTLEFEAITERFINAFESLDTNTASRLIVALHPFPSIFSQSPSSASRAIVAAFKNLPENISVDGVILVGLIKLQSSLTGWENSEPDDLDYLISMVCAIGPDDWHLLQPVQDVVGTHLLRIRDQDLLGLWGEIMNSVDIVESNRMSSAATDNLNPSTTSNYSPEDTASVATLDTGITSTSGVAPLSSNYRQLSTGYHPYHPPHLRARDFNIPKSVEIIRSLPQARRTPAILTKLLDTLRFVRRKRERLLPETFGRLIQVAGRSHRMDVVGEAFEFAEATVREVMPENEVAFSEWCQILNSMIIANAFNRNNADARFYQQELMNLGVAPDSDAFAAYIVNLNVNGTNDEATEALALFHEARSLGVPPSTFLYNTLISKLAKARRSDDALYYFHEMKANGLPPSSVTFGTVINACCRVGNEALALKYFDEMEADRYFVPRIAPYNTMLQFYVQTTRDRSKALQFYEKMRAQLITPSAHTYKLLIDAYATLEAVDVAAAENILKLITSDRQNPTTAHYAAIIHAYGCVKQDLESANNWFYKVTDGGNPQAVKPDETLYQALIEAYVANHQVANCDEVFQHMRANNVKLTVYMANHLIHGWTIDGNLEQARRVFDSLATEKNGLYGREPSSYEQMTRSYLAMGDRVGAETLVEEMKTKGYPSAVVARVSDILHGGDGYDGLVQGVFEEEARI